MYKRQAYDGIGALLDRLRDEGAVLAVATSKRRYLAEQILDHYGLRDRFTVVAGAHDDGSGGGKHEVVERVVAELDPPDGATVFMIGDRDSDLRAGQSHGASAIGVRWGYARPGELEAVDGATLVATMDELATELLGR